MIQPFTGRGIDVTAVIEISDAFLERACQWYDMCKSPYATRAGLIAFPILSPYPLWRTEQ